MKKKSRKSIVFGLLVLGLIIVGIKQFPPGFQLTDAAQSGASLGSTSGFLR